MPKASLNDWIPERLEFAKSRLHLRSFSTYAVGSYVHPNSEIGSGTIILNNVVIDRNVKIGKNCLIKSGSVIGEKGFSFGFEKDLTPVEIVHTGGVIIGDNVEIGALCTVASGTVEPTVIKDYVKIDDHVHVAHNCKIKPKSIIAAGVKLCGGVQIGWHCWIGLGATIFNKVKIADHSVIGVGANVIKDTEEFDVVAGNPAKFLKKRIYLETDA